MYKINVDVQALQTRIVDKFMRKIYAQVNTSGKALTRMLPKQFFFTRYGDCEPNLSYVTMK